MFYSFYCELLIIMVHIIPVEHLLRISELDHIRKVMGVLHHPTLPVMV